MPDISSMDYSALDILEVLQRLFHPRPEAPPAAATGRSQDLLIPVAPGVVVGARFHPTAAAAPTILFFHGNGEIVADYDELAPAYNQVGSNFLPVDYRGYGRSTGSPTVAAMMHDCHVILDFVARWLGEHGYRSPLLAMGRSLGSASAIKLAANYPERISGLIVESGFAYAAPLLRVLGVDPDALGFREEKGFLNVDEIRRVAQPTLIVHGEQDQIIPFSDGRALFDACAAADKTLLKIAGANHNDLLWQGFPAYMAAVQALVEKVRDT